MFRLRLRFYLLFLFIFVPGLVACSLASGGQPGSAAAPTATQVPANSTPTNTPRYTIGEQVPVGSWVITVEAYSSSGDTSYTPKAGSALLIFTISQQNRGSRLATANGAVGWHLSENSGTMFPLITQSGYGTFPSQTVGAGEAATGILVYEVPTSVQSARLTFAPTSGDAQASWDIALGQI